MMTLLCLLISMATAAPITIATGEYPPYVGENIPAQGFSTQIVKAIYKEINQEITIKFMPWSRVMNHLKKGDIAGSYPWLHSNERAAIFLYSEPLHYYRTLLFTNKDSETAAIDITGKKFCQPIGWDNTFYSELEKKYKTTLVRPVNVESCMHMLQLKRVDLVVMNEFVGRNILKKIYGNNPPIIGTPTPTLGQENTLYFIVPKNYPNAQKIIEDFNVGLRKIKKNGMYAKIMESYLKKESSISNCEICNQLGSL